MAVDNFIIVITMVFVKISQHKAFKAQGTHFQ